MAVEVKICGINTAEAMSAAIGGGAGLVGLVFYPPSPRYLGPTQAAALASRVPPGVARVGLFVDPDDALLSMVLEQVPIELIQLHEDVSKGVLRVEELLARRVESRFVLPDEALQVRSQGGSRLVLAHALACRLHALAGRRRPAARGQEIEARERTP